MRTPLWAIAMVAFVALVLPAKAATVTLVSMQYSAAHPVPHLHYDGGTEQGDVERLQEAYDQFVRCRLDCIGQMGGSTAVLTLNGPGGSYGTGLMLADFLRENHIATVVERDMQCYSACAFAFLGGSGWSPLSSVGTYIDRMVEPGSIVGFHAPYLDEASFFQDLDQQGAMGSQTRSRSNLALMVNELVKWNVDPLVLFDMMSMGPDESYNLTTPESLYLTRTALPPTPTRMWVADWPAALANACMRLLAIYDNVHPYEEYDRMLGTSFQNGIGTGELGSLSGFKLSDSWLDAGHCSATDKSLETGGDVDLALYGNPVMGSTSRTIISFFNRNDGWSNAGIGGLPTKRIYQRGPMNHFFLPMGVEIDDLNLPAELAIADNRFFTPATVGLPPLPAGMDVVSDFGRARVSRQGDVWMFEQVGNARLFDSAVDETYGFGFSNEGIGATSFVRDGTYPDGSLFAWIGFRDEGVASITHIMALKPAGTAATEAEHALIYELECATTFQGQSLAC